MSSIRAAAAGPVRGALVVIPAHGTIVAFKTISLDKTNQLGVPGATRRERTPILRLEKQQVVGNKVLSQLLDIWTEASENTGLDFVEVYPIGSGSMSRQQGRATLAFLNRRPRGLRQRELVAHALQPAFDLLEEAGGGETIEGAVVEAEGEVHHRADADHVVHDDRTFDDRLGRDDRDLGLDQDRGGGDRAEGAGVVDGEGAAGDV